MVFILNTTSYSSSPALDEEFGFSVDTDGYYAVVGAPLKDSGRGAVYIFKKQDSGTWAFSRQLLSSNPQVNSFFGYDVAIDKNYIVVGQYGYDNGGFVNAGAISFFRRTWGDKWNQEDFIVSPISSANEEFGKSVDINDNYIVVGTPGSNSNKGRAYLFEIESDYNLTQLSSFSEITSTLTNYAGYSVAVNSSFVSVGAIGNDNGKGIVHLYYKDQGGEDNWGLYDSLVASDGVNNDAFGSSISMSGNYIVIGAPDKMHSDGSAFAGAVYIFKFIEDQWYEIKKIVGYGETSTYESNNFGKSVYINNDYIIVGSPGARSSRGIVDVFYRKKSWDHLEKIVFAGGNSGDNFGCSVAMSDYDKTIIIGAYAGDTPSVTDSGAISFYGDSTTTLRLAQEFSVNRNYVPTKASIYLKRIGNNLSDHWTIYNNIKNVIDATNFSNLTQRTNKIIFDDRISGYTGNGYMALANEDPLEIIGSSSNNFGILEYPIRAASADTFDLWIRCQSSESSIFESDILLDNHIISQINETVVEGQWEWVRKRIVIPDTREHILGIRLMGKGNLIDKIYLDAEDVDEYLGQENLYIPVGEGPSYTISPYLTLHLKVYSTSIEDEYDEYTPSWQSFSVPVSPLFIYDYKTTREEVIQDDWYNFNIRILDSRMGYSNSFDFYGNYFLVLSITGRSDINSILWQLVDNDEYLSLPCAIRI